MSRQTSSLIASSVILGPIVVALAVAIVMSLPRIVFGVITGIVVSGLTGIAIWCALDSAETE